MTRIALLSDTHGILHSDIADAVTGCEEIWHAGDVGSTTILDQLQKLAPVRAVWGNIDDASVRQRLPEDDLFVVDGANVLLSHIVGHPKGLHRRARTLLKQHDADLVIYGHSHILRLDYDGPSGSLFVNPGAMGNSGMHLIRTMMRFTLTGQGLSEFEILELGNRGQPFEGITKVVAMEDWPLRARA